MEWIEETVPYKVLPDEQNNTVKEPDYLLLKDG